jgi:membrane-associated phospholipid phosphatase
MGRRRTHALLVLIAFIPMVLAGFVASTRVSDFRHRGGDVLAGAALGVIVTLIVYRHWHPWLTDRLAGIPWDVLRMDEIEKQAVLVEALPTLHPNDERYTSVEAKV